MDLFDLVAKITLDTGEYEKALDNAQNMFNGARQNIDEAIEGISSSFSTMDDAADASTTNISSSLSDLADLLNQTGADADTLQEAATGALEGIREELAQMEAAGEDVSALSSTFDELGSAFESGEMSAEEFLSTLTGMASEIEGATSAADAAAKAVDQVGDATEEAGEQAEGASGKSSGFIDTLKGMLAANLVTAAVTKLANALTSMIPGFAELGDHIDKTSQKLGISAQAYQEWDAIMQHSGTSVDSAVASMKTLSNAVQNASDKQVEAFAAIGLSIQEAQSLSQEDLFARTIEGLQNMEAGAERTATATTLLGRGAMEMGALLNTSAEDTEAMRQRVHELGGVLSDDAVKASAAFQDSLQDMQTAFGGVRNRIAGEFLPSLTEMMDGITEIFASGEGAAQLEAGINGFLDQIGATLTDGFGNLGLVIQTIFVSALEHIPDAITTVFDAAVNIVTNVGQTLPGAIQKILGQIPQMLTSIISGIRENLPKLLDTAFEIVGTLVRGVLSSLPELVKAAVGIVTTLAEEIGGRIDDILKLGYDIIIGLVRGIIGSIPQLAMAGPKIIMGLVKGLLESLPDLLATVPQMMGELAQAWIDQIPVLIGSVGEMWDAVLDFLTSIDWIQLAKDIISGIIKGVLSMGKAVGDAVISLFKPETWKRSSTENGKDVGAAFGGGVAEGIESAEGAVEGATTGMTAAAASAADSFSQSAGVYEASVANMQVAMGKFSLSADAFKFNVESAGQAVGAFAETVSTTAPEFEAAGQSAIQAYSNGVATESANLYKSTYKTISNAVSKTATNTNSNWTDLGTDSADWLSGGISDSESELVGVGEESAVAFADGFTSQADYIADSAYNAVSHAAEAARQPTTWINVGLEAMSRIAQGIQSGQSVVLNAMVSALRVAVSSAIDQVLREANMYGNRTTGGTSNNYGGFSHTTGSFASSIAAGSRTYSAAPTNVYSPTFGSNTINVYPSQGMDEEALARSVSDNLYDVYSRSVIGYGFA